MPATQWSSPLRRLRYERASVAHDPRQFTVAQVAERIGCSERALKYWEAGRVPRLVWQKRLARLYKVTVEDLGYNGTINTEAPLM